LNLLHSRGRGYRRAAAAGEGVVDRRGDLGEVGVHDLGADGLGQHLVVALAALAVGHAVAGEALGNLLARGVQDAGVVRVLPEDDLLQGAKEPLALGVLRLLGRKLLGPGGRVIY
jgi:hypothetical protein